MKNTNNMVKLYKLCKPTRQQQKEAKAKRKMEKEKKRKQRASMKEAEIDAVREKDKRARSKSRERNCSTLEGRAKHLAQRKIYDQQHRALKKAASPSAAAADKLSKLNFVSVPSQKETVAGSRPAVSADLTPMKRESSDDKVMSCMGILLRT